MQTITKINQENKAKFVMVSREFGEPIFIGKPTLKSVTPAFDKKDAQVWDYADTLSSVKLDYHKSVTALNLVFEQI